MSEYITVKRKYIEQAIDALEKDCDWSVRESAAKALRSEANHAEAHTEWKYPRFCRCMGEQAKKYCQYKNECVIITAYTQSDND